jgi:hypothetical protein
MKEIQVVEIVNSHWWFVKPAGVVADVWRQKRALSIGQKLSRFHLKMETESHL